MPVPQLRGPCPATVKIPTIPFRPPKLRACTGVQNSGSARVGVRNPPLTTDEQPFMHKLHNLHNDPSPMHNSQHIVLQGLARLEIAKNTPEKNCLHMHKPSPSSNLEIGTWNLRLGTCSRSERCPLLTSPTVISLTVLTQLRFNGRSPGRNCRPSIKLLQQVTSKRSQTKFCQTVLKPPK
jgi:hypothetical protein